MVRELRQEMFAREMLEGMPSSASYKAGQLSTLLLGLQSSRVSGVVRIEITEPSVQQRTLVFREGALSYAGKAIPSPREFVAELSRYMQINLVETVLEFAAKRSSVQSLLSTMVQIGVLEWSDIKVAMRKQATAVVGGLLKTSGKVIFEPADASTFSLTYDGEEPGFSIDALLLEVDLRKGPQSPPNGSVPAYKPPAPLEKPPVPAMRSRSEKPALEHRPPSKGSAQKPTKDGQDDRPVILSVDDSSIAQALVKRALGKQYRVIVCNNPLEALSKLEHMDNIALMLLDITMPDMNGLEFCRMVRKIDKFKGLPVVMVTARDGVVDRFRGRVAGVNHYLTKPVKPAELIDIVAQYAALPQ